MKKLICFVLAAVMLLSLAACNNEKPVETQPPKETQGTNKPVETTVPVETGVDHSEHITLKYVTKINMDMPGGEAVEEAVNAYLTEKLNMSLDITFIPGSEWGERANVMLNSGSGWDIILASGTSFTNAASRNAFYPLTDYLDTLLAGAAGMLPQAAIDVFTVNGEVYGMCPEKDLAVQWGIQENQTMLDTLGVTFPENYDTAWDLLPYWRELKAKRDEKYPEYKDMPLHRIDLTGLDAYFYYDPLLSNLAVTNLEGLSGFNTADTKTVYCPFETDEFVRWAKAINAMVADGISATDKTFDADQVLKKAGLVPAKAVTGVLETSADMNAPYFTTKQYLSKNAVFTTAYMQTDAHVINAQCKYPERAMEFIDLLYTDEYLATTLRFGVEGQDWEDADNDGSVELIGRNSDSVNRYWYNWYGHWFGSLTTSKRAPGLTEVFDESLEYLNTNATASPALGFIVDTANIVNEIAACNNVVSEYLTQIRKPTGTEDVDALCADFVAKLKANGIDKIVAEVQAQLDAFYAAK